MVAAQNPIADQNAAGVGWSVVWLIVFPGLVITRFTWKELVDTLPHSWLTPQHWWDEITYRTANEQNKAEVVTQTEAEEVRRKRRAFEKCRENHPLLPEFMYGPLEAFLWFRARAAFRKLPRWHVQTQQSKALVAYTAIAPARRSPRPADADPHSFKEHCDNERQRQEGYFRKLPVFPYEWREDIRRWLTDPFSPARERKVFIGGADRALQNLIRNFFELPQRHAWAVDSLYVPRALLQRRVEQVLQEVYDYLVQEAGRTREEPERFVITRNPGDDYESVVPEEDEKEAFGRDAEAEVEYGEPGAPERRPFDHRRGAQLLGNVLEWSGTTYRVR